MRVVFLLSSWRKQGVLGDRESLWVLTQHLTDQGFEVFVLAGRARLGLQEVEKAGAKVYFLLDSQAGSLGSSLEAEFSQKAAQFILDKWQDDIPTVLHFLSDVQVDWFLPLRKKKNIRWVTDVAVLKLEGLFRILNSASPSARSQLATLIKSLSYFFYTFLTHDREILSVSDAVVVSSPEQRFFLERYYMYPERRIALIPQTLGFYDAHFDALPADFGRELTERVPVMTDRPAFFLLLTDMVDKADWQSVIEAFEKVAIKKNHCFLGILGNGPLYKMVEFEVLNRALGNRAFLLGDRPQAEVVQWIEFSDIILDLSPIYRRNELYLAYALWRGRVVVASELGAMAHVIEPGVDGFLVRPSDAKMIEDVLLRYLGGELAVEAIRGSAKTKAEQVFSPGRVLEALTGLYHKVIEDRPRP